MPKPDQLGPKQPALWRLADRVQLLLYRDGWPARLSHRLGVRTVPRIARHAIEVNGFAPLTTPLTLAFASDFHAGVTTDPWVLRRACAMLEAADADLLLLGGDFVSLDARQIEWLAPLLGRIPARLGRFAVLGNHDYWNGAGQVIRSLERAGIELLTNRNRRLPPPFDQIWICGLDDFLAGTPDPVAAFDGADGTRIVLMHAPANLLNLRGHQFDMAICGHTHGGQIALPGGTPIHVAVGPLSRTYNRGRFRLDDGGTLIVSVGLGCSTVPFRANSNPEVIVCTITSAAAPPGLFERL